MEEIKNQNNIYYRTELLDIYESYDGQNISIPSILNFYDINSHIIDVTYRPKYVKDIVHESNKMVANSIVNFFLNKLSSCIFLGRSFIIPFNNTRLEELRSFVSLKNL